MAESLRNVSENAAEERRFKLTVFATLMQERSEISSNESVKALNSIDVAFGRSMRVRDAWVELYETMNNLKDIPYRVLDERYRQLLKEMAADLGLSEHLRLDDFKRVYVPQAIVEERHVRDLQRKSALQQLVGLNSPETNAADDDPKGWPPRPG